MDESHVADTTASANAPIENATKSEEAQKMSADAQLASADPTGVEAAGIPNVAAEKNDLTGDAKDTPVGAVSTTAIDGEAAAVGNGEVVSGEAKEKPVEAVSATATEGEGAAVANGELLSGEAKETPVVAKSTTATEEANAVADNGEVLSGEAKETPVEAKSTTATVGADAVADTGEASTGPATSQAAMKIESSDQPRKRSYNDRDTRESYKKRKHRRENVKSDLTSQAPSDDPDEIRKQVCRTIMLKLTI